MSSANAFKLGQSKILSFGKELMALYHTFFTLQPYYKQQNFRLVQIENICWQLNIIGCPFPIIVFHTT